MLSLLCRNATLRSKAEAKSRTFLWVYGRIVLQQQGVTSLETFEKAVQQYLHIPQAEPLETIRVRSVLVLLTLACANDVTSIDKVCCPTVVTGA